MLQVSYRRLCAEARLPRCVSSWTSAVIMIIISKPGRQIETFRISIQFADHPFQNLIETCYFSSLSEKQRGNAKLLATGNNKINKS